jgi:hypothetical protein
METIHQEGSSATEVHDMCVCSTLYCTTPNMPATSGEYHNEHARYPQPESSPLAFHNLITRP